VIPLGEPSPEVIYNKVLNLTEKEAHILGIGNIAGRIKYGSQIVAYFKHKSKQHYEDLKWLNQ
jgi:hypothetical protein